MKRFFDLSILFLLPILIFSTFNKEAEPIKPDFSEQAYEIYNLIGSEAGIDINLESIQMALDNKALMANAPTLPCDPPNGCYAQGHLDRLLLSFGCCGKSCQWPCLDMNGDGCITAADLTFLLGHYCTD
ncbi:MAG: hypothetical protein AB8F74_00100 [Saprospiraceae bacterium]